jgi:ABC-type uncharacterized transport system auxiliary subunit
MRLIACLAALAAVLSGCAMEESTTSFPKKPAPSKAPVESIHAEAGKAISPEVLGLALYPGAKVVTSGTEGKIVSANLETADATDKVTKFYEGELGAKAETKGGLLSVQGAKGGTRYAIVVLRSGGTTSISIMGEKQ